MRGSWPITRSHSQRAYAMASSFSTSRRGTAPSVSIGVGNRQIMSMPIASIQRLVSAMSRWTPGGAFSLPRPVRRAMRPPMFWYVPSGDITPLRPQPW